MADTIAAIATAPVQSAIGIIRISGPEAAQIASSVFIPSGGLDLNESPGRTMLYGSMLDKNRKVIDHCLCVVFRPGYTGEETVELQCHGSPMVLAEGLEAVFSAGARQALAGEFTKRAFLNGRLDLTQAEAVADIIAAETPEAVRNAAGQLGGAIFRKINAVYSSLVNIMSHFYAAVDYPEEDIEDFELPVLLGTLDSCASELDKLVRSFGRGRLLKDGIKSAIVGRPNAGKSSLLNALLGFDRAIVTPIAGTTRDTIEEKILLGGILLRLSDTAGLRQTDDAVEVLGVNRALDAISESELAIAVFDGSEPLQAEDYVVMDRALSAPKAIAVINKSDLPLIVDLSPIRDRFERVCVVSALEFHGLEALENEVKLALDGNNAPSFDGGILTNPRQAEAAARARDSLIIAADTLRGGLTPDAVLTEAELALEALGELTGRTMREDILNRIFERFCVGK